jgi:uncharacterized surface protein with fasciclin (FAS1) repeats
MKTFKKIALSVVAVVLTSASFAQNSKTVVENAIASKDHTTLVAAVKAAGLVETLSGKGPFTVFAPVNTAFAKLPAGTVESLLKPENLKSLQSILTYHVVAGTFDSTGVVAAIKAGKGKATLITVQGGALVASLEGKNVILTDEKGNKSTITAVDITSSNGVIHIIDTVLLPR